MRKISRLELAWEEEEVEENRRKKGMRDYDSSWLLRGDNGRGRCRAAMLANGRKLAVGWRERRISADLACARIIGEPRTASSRDRRREPRNFCSGMKVAMYLLGDRRANGPRQRLPALARRIRAGNTLVYAFPLKKRKGKKENARATFTLVIHVISHASAAPCNRIGGLDVSD